MKKDKQNVASFSFKRYLKTEDINYNRIIEIIKQDFNPSNSVVANYKFSHPLLFNKKGSKTILVLISYQETGKTEFYKSLKNREKKIIERPMTKEELRFKPVAWAEVDITGLSPKIKYLKLSAIQKKYGINTDVDELLGGREINDSDDLSSLLSLQNRGKDLINYFVTNKSIRSDYTKYLDDLAIIHMKYKSKLYHYILKNIQEELNK